MSDKINLKELQRKAISSFHEDGIIDIMIGLLGLIWGFSAFTDDQYLSVIWIAVVIPSYWWMKREYTVPRIGLVRFSQRGEGGLPRIVVTALVGAGVAVGFVLFWAFAEASKPFYYVIIIEYWKLIMGITAAVVSAIYARVAYLKRFYVYSALILSLIGSAQYTGLAFGVHILILGTVILGCGCYLLYGFTRRYQVQVVDGQDG